MGLRRNNYGWKGDMPRPFSVDKDVFNDNWDRIFKKKRAKKRQKKGEKSKGLRS